MPPERLVLAFDTSVAHCAAALLLGDRVLAARQEPIAKGQAERLFLLLQELLDGAGVAWRDLARIGVGTGPGNFTGIRIAVASARGLALSLGIPAIGVTTFQALALDLERPIVAAVDGRAGRLYLQKFVHDGAHDPVTVASDVAAAAPLFGDQPSLVGHGAQVLAAERGVTLCTPRHPVAVAIALVAARAEAADAPRPAPLYMRAPDAAPPRDVAPKILA